MMLNRNIGPENLYMTQSDLRSYTSLVHGLFNFNRKVNIITFDCIPTYNFIRDGHHLAIALIAKFGYIPFDRLEISNSTISHYMEFNPASGWYTPFNPFIEQRLPDVSNIKKYIAREVVPYGNKETTGEYVYKKYGWLYLNKSKKPLSVKEFIMRYQYES